MSDDRFKQARRSLIDRNKQRQEQQQDGRAPDDFGDDDFHEDEKTLLVNVDEFQSGDQNAPPPTPGPPPQDDFADAATQMVDIDSLEGGPNPPGNVEERTEPQREALSRGTPSRPQPAANPQQANQQVFSPGGGGGHEGKTDFINLDDFADFKPEFTPESQSAGYEGKTEFIHIDAIEGGPGGQAGGQQAPAPSNIAGDQMLQRSYQFGPQSVQQGEITLIFAQNPLGKAVVLRQVWSGDPGQMPAEMRQRIARIDALNHPRLVQLNGVVATETGLWADLAKPAGYRLSAVLQQHGPQDQENVANWMRQLAEVLDEIHRAGLIYANLTPDAVWIQEDNSIVLEPFDLLSFEHRGNLGAFGAQELHRPPQDRQLSPATDVYSLAAVGAAALSGLPFHPDKLANLEDQKLTQTIETALSSNPNERPQSALDLADQFKGGGFSLDNLNLNPADFDIKVVAAIAVLLLGGFAGYMYWNKQQAQEAAEQQQRQQQAQQAAVPVDSTGEPAPGDGPEAAGEDTAAVAAPGELADDPRLEIVSSYQQNPPSEDARDEMNATEAAEEAAQRRATASEHIEKAKDLRSRQERLDEYTMALEEITRAIRLNGGTPTDEDKELLEKLRSEKSVRTYETEVRKRVKKAIDKGSIGEARFPYRRLSSIDYRAGAARFFDNYSNPRVRVVNEPKEDEDDDE